MSLRIESYKKKNKTDQIIEVEQIGLNEIQENQKEELKILSEKSLNLKELTLKNNSLQFERAEEEKGESREKLRESQTSYSINDREDEQSHFDSTFQDREYSDEDN